jgi:3-deoxy-D-manno-octulosonic-acid transferase
VQLRDREHLAAQVSDLLENEERVLEMIEVAESALMAHRDACEATIQKVMKSL